MEGDHERDLPVPLLASALAQVAPRLLDRGLDVVQPVEDAEIVKRGRDRDLVLVVRRQRCDRPGEVVDAVRVVAVTLERHRLAARELAPRIEDLVDERMTL
jgi:hypothetical protein